MSERGEMSLVSLMLATLIFSVVGWGTLVAVTTLERQNAETTRRAEAQSTARIGMDRLARELRNAKPDRDPVSGTTVLTLQRPRDVQFLTVDPVERTGNDRHLRRMRACAAGGTLWLVQQTWSGAAIPPPPSAAGCPGTGTGAGDWTDPRVLADDLVGTGAIFRYESRAGITTRVRVDLAIDPAPDRPPGPLQIRSAFFLRAGNGVPVANFSATASGGKIVLNASASSDPEEKRLTYVWSSGSTTLGQGVVFAWTGRTVGQSYSVTLTVSDPAGETASVTKTVTA